MNNCYVKIEFFLGTIRILGSTISSTALFVITILIYVMVIAYQDKQALLFNDNWIFKEDNIDYGLGTSHRKR